MEPNSALRRYRGMMIKKQDNLMSGDLAHILDLGDLAQANEEFALVNENTGYNPYDNPGTHRELRDEND